MSFFLLKIRDLLGGRCLWTMGSSWLIFKANCQVLSPEVHSIYLPLNQQLDLENSLILAETYLKIHLSLYFFRVWMRYTHTQIYIYIYTCNHIYYMYTYLDTRSHEHSLPNSRCSVALDDSAPRRGMLHHGPGMWGLELAPGRRMLGPWAAVWRMGRFQQPKGVI